MKQIIKLVLLVHRYLGFALSLLFVIWFLSGFVMMYVTYPTMRQQERLEHSPTLNLTHCRFTLQQALDHIHCSDTLRTVRLGMLLDRPVYRITTIHNQNKAIYADTGELLPPMDTILTKKLAVSFIHNNSQPDRVETLTAIDQWMAAARSMGYQPPVHRFTMNDSLQTYIYVSIQTGEVVQMVNASQRFWAWLGPIPHWIYPTILLRNRPLWNDIILWTSSLGTIMCIAGIAMGIIRYRRKDKSALAFSPYKKKWFLWHHYTGFVFGLFVFTWVFSGLLSMTPWNWAPAGRLTPEESQVWNGGVFQPNRFTLSPSQAAIIFQSKLNVKEITFLQVDGKQYYLAWQDQQHTALLTASDSSAENLFFIHFPTRSFVQKIRDLNPGIRLSEAVVLSEYDEYYYLKHDEIRYRDKHLPILRVKMDTPEKTWYYVDLQTGQVALRSETRNRWERWLYHGLHSLDFGWLRSRRPLWDIIMFVLLTGGLLASSTGLVLTWKWIKRKVSPKHVHHKIEKQRKSRVTR
ncbi:PepSY domain-containing protein [Cytophagaceae bacterium YF14B1]|uniref:PepSY domain-containing protein n=1 Tax=Xanthocytophaga flava TaxID=3048013 RepID=A0AAE3QNT8_9BACT|nr:PepSY domain-containing protein [Xanthocytophaga flavus]MDJ1482505.1 PepSY domain-containing protein [Xanthocytophaga flavus]